ncbi:hypothetical protein T492DRAFT_854024 [Pavlovales sp. CCMP2436]|nr:hypothetical protein T492DRAFT_854024 [Pavlovales sp. CCMP2436]
MLPLPQGRPTASFALLSFALGAATFLRTGYAVNHLDIAPAHAAVWRRIFRAFAVALLAAALFYSQCARGDELFPPTAKAGGRDTEGGKYSSSTLRRMTV